MGRVDWLRSMAGGRFGYAIFLALFWAYASVLGAVLAVTGLGRDTHGLVPFVLIVGCWLLAYQGAVQTVAWWRRRQARQG